MSPEERARREAEAKAEAERVALASRNNVYERALKHMMNGTLESKRDDDDAAAPQRADWMAGDPKKFNAEQNKEWKEFQAREKAYLEDRAKRRGILEAEVRTLRAGVDEFASKFDEALLALAGRKLATHMEVLYLEMRIILLAGCVCTVLRRTVLHHFVPYFFLHILCARRRRCSVLRAARMPPLCLRLTPPPSPPPQNTRAAAPRSAPT